MKELIFPKLQATDIDVRVGSGGNNNATWCTLLLYKDARVDQRLLDAVVGCYNWQREHIIRENIVNGAKVMVNYCKVSIWDDEKKMWIAKEDCGTESQTEPIKGEASDSFKRACFNWGIGRELYTTPKNTFINLTEADYKNGKLKIRFTCKAIAYDEQGRINYLVILDDKGNVRFSMDERTLDDAIAMVRNQNDLAGVVQVFNQFKKYQSNENFVKVCGEMKNKFTKANGKKK